MVDYQGTPDQNPNDEISRQWQEIAAEATHAQMSTEQFAKAGELMARGAFDAEYKLQIGEEAHKKSEGILDWLYLRGIDEADELLDELEATKEQGISGGIAHVATKLFGMAEKRYSNGSPAQSEALAVAQLADVVTYVAGGRIAANESESEAMLAEAMVSNEEALYDNKTKQLVKQLIEREDS